MTELLSQDYCDDVDLACQVRDIQQMELVDKLLSSVPVFVLLVNERRQVVYANGTLLNFLDVEARAVIGRPPGDVLQCSHALEDGQTCGETGSCLYCGANIALMAGLAGHVCTEECRIVRDASLDPPALDLRVRSSPLMLNGETFVLMAAEDITDEKRRQVLERTFFHDILNTATVLDGATKLMLSSSLDGSTLPAEDDASIRRIIGQVSQRLIDEIVTQRDLSEMENGELEPEANDVLALPFLDGLAVAYASQAIAADRTLVIAPDSEDLVFVADQTLLGRVLGNLIKNAIEASQPGETVTVGCRTMAPAQVEFWVHNEAVMPDEVKAQVFERSFSTKGRGRGVGTYSIKLLTERYLEGSVSFDSRVGAGTTFRVRYPISPSYAQ